MRQIIQSFLIHNAFLPQMQRLLKLFSPGRKFKTGNTKHVYALEYPEPLVHFALSSGVYSDPVVCIFLKTNQICCYHRFTMSILSTSFF